MRATILLKAESGSGNDRRLRTARSSIQTLPSAIDRSPEEVDHFLLQHRHALPLERS
jgi:hypothetical protein